MRRNAVTLLVLAALAAPGAARAQSAPQPVPADRSILTAEGSGHSEAKPDFARITAVVSAKGQNLETAVRAEQDILGNANSLLQSLANEGVEVEKSNFSLASDRPPYPRPDAPQGPPSFTASTTFSLKAVRIDRLNAAVSKLASSGLFELRAVSFELTDTRAPLDEARRNAVADARHRAEVLAEAAGVRLEGIATISEGNAAPRVYTAAAAASPASLVIPPATLNFTASVTISWRVWPKP